MMPRGCATQPVLLQQAHSLWAVARPSASRHSWRGDDSAHRIQCKCLSSTSCPRSSSCPAGQRSRKRPETYSFQSDAGKLGITGQGTSANVPTARTQELLSFLLQAGVVHMLPYFGNTTIEIGFPTVRCVDTTVFHVRSILLTNSDYAAAGEFFVSTKSLANGLTCRARTLIDHAKTGC